MPKSMEFYLPKSMENSLPLTTGSHLQKNLPILRLFPWSSFCNHIESTPTEIIRKKHLSGNRYFKLFFLIITWNPFPESGKIFQTAQHIDVELVMQARIEKQNRIYRCFLYLSPNGKWIVALKSKISKENI